MSNTPKRLLKPTPTVESLLRGSGALFVVSLTVGCANPGPPRPPSLRLPTPAQHLTALRIDSHVLLTWTTSADTTDGDALRGPISAVICRQDILLPLAAQHPTPCNPVQRIPVVAGPTEIQIALPTTLLEGPNSLLGFQVEILNEHNRSAGPSAWVYAPAGKAPPPAGPIAVSTLRNAAQILWNKADAEAPMQLSRSLVSTTSITPAKLAVRSKSRQTKSDATPQQATLTLPASQADPGGMVDRSIHDGDTLTYTGQRVRTVSFPSLAPQPEPANGQAPKHHEPAPSTITVEMRGEPSPPVTFTFHDTLPPASPAGLIAIPGGGFGATAPNDPPTPLPIDLSWEPNSEPDLLGYNIYRAEAGGSFLRLNPQPLPGTSFRDLSARPGRDYAYRVTALDQRHNESAPSLPLHTHE